MASHPISEMLDGAMDKIRGMVDSNTVVGEPIVTPDGVTMIPVSRISFGFTSGANDGTEGAKKSGVWAGSGAAVKVDPIGFLMIRDGSARMVSVQPPAFSTADRVIDMIPELLDRVEGMVEKYAPKKEAPERGSAE